MGINEKDEPAVPVSPLVWSCRLNLTLGVSMGLFLHYFIRYNLSVAIVCMVKPQMDDSVSNDTDVPPSLDYNISGTAPLEGQCATDGGVSGPDFGYEGEFEWSRRQVGYILASYFYSYVLVQVFSGWLASRVGGKHVFGTGMLVAAVCTLLFPVCARTHVALVFLIRVLQGISTGVTFPTTHAIMGLWIPPTERSRLIGVCFTAPILGSVTANIVAGQLCTVAYDNGWPLVFYLAGGLTVLWYLWWLRFVYSSPESHPRISEQEKTYIQTSLSMTGVKQVCTRLLPQKLTVPWRAMLTSRPVWAICCAHAASGYGLYTVLTVIPLYMQDVLQYSIRNNGLLSSLPSVLNIVVGMSHGFTSDALIARRLLSTGSTRKLMTALGCLGPALFFIIISFMGCEQRGWAIAMLCLGVIFHSGHRAGCLLNHADIAPRFAGIVYGISNTLANTTGFMVPLVTGALTPNGTQAEWQRVFFICAAVNVTAFIIYTCWASGELQPWARVIDPEPKDTTAGESLMVEIIDVKSADQVAQDSRIVENQQQNST